MNKENSQALRWTFLLHFAVLKGTFASRLLSGGKCQSGRAQGNPGHAAHVIAVLFGLSQVYRMPSAIDSTHTPVS